MGTAIFPTGTITVFRQTAAPLGWTKITTYNNFTLRIVSGSASTGGSIDFTSAMLSQTISGSVSNSVSTFPLNITSGSTLADLPSHLHSAGTRYFNSIVPITAGPAFAPRNVWTNRGFTSPSGPQGGNEGHSHTLTVNSVTFQGTTKNFSVNYVDLIVASIN
jgi:hypothetical protein